MNGFDKLKEELKEQDPNDYALNETVNYLLTRKDMEPKYLNEEKSIEQMRSFIRSRGQKHLGTGWSFIMDKVVFAWAIMYYSLPNNFLKINTEKSSKSTTKGTEVTAKNNVVSLEEAKERLEKKKENEQLSIFGGVAK